MSEESQEATLRAIERELPGLEVQPLRLQEIRARLAAEADGAHTPRGDNGRGGGGQIDLAGLYLASECRDGNPAALALFDALHMRQVDAVYARLRPPSLTLDDARQMVRSRLFVRTPERPPRIGSYRGAGGLATWTRVIATRLLLNATSNKGVRHERPTSDGRALEQRTDRAADVEMDFIRLRYGEVLTQCLRTAAASLSSDDRLVLRWQLKGFSAAEIGRLRGVNMRTMQRRIVDIHERLAATLSEELRSRSINAADGRSLLRALIDELSLGSMSSVSPKK